MFGYLVSTNGYGVCLNSCSELVCIRGYHVKILPFLSSFHKTYKILFQMFLIINYTLSVLKSYIEFDLSD